MLRTVPLGPECQQLFIILSWHAVTLSIVGLVLAVSLFVCVSGWCCQVSLVVNDEQTEVTDISIEVSEQGCLVVNAPTSLLGRGCGHRSAACWLLLTKTLSTLDGFDVACHFA